MASTQYVGEMGDRDLRIDFLRGVAMTVLLLVHFEFYSWYNLIIWERIGFVTGAEIFVALSGIVVGMVYKRKIEKEGLKAAAFKLLDRAAQLYRVNLFIIFSVFLISLISTIDSRLLTTYINEYTGEISSLFPTAAEMKPVAIVGHLLLLKSSPPYTQILGLYTILLLVAPLALWAMQNKKTGIVLGLSLLAYFANQAYPSTPTGAQFEYGFPLLAWQVLFFMGMAVGFHRENIAKFMSVPLGKIIFGILFLTFFAFLFIAQNTSNPNLPEWSKLHFISSQKFDHWYFTYFVKDRLDVARIINLVAVLSVAYWALTRYWKIVVSTLGKFFIPLGQATLYVFVVHVFLILILSNTHLIKMGNNQLTMHSGNIWLNTLIHTGVLILVWYMVKKQVLFKWIPR